MGLVSGGFDPQVGWTSGEFDYRWVKGHNRVFLMNYSHFLSFEMKVKLSSMSMLPVQVKWK